MKVDDWVEGIILGQKAACFGSRETPKEVLDLMERLGTAMAALGGKMASGHCKGADLAFERGACRVKPESFTVCLPWKTYNVEDYPITEGCPVQILADMHPRIQKNMLGIAAECHPKWDRLSNGGRLLMGRNILIAAGANWGFTYLNHNKLGMGGSGQCYRFLIERHVPVVDLSMDGQAAEWDYILKRMGF